MVEGLRWEIFGNYARNVNEVVRITEDISELTVGGPYTTGVTVVAAEGQPFGTYKGLAMRTNDAGEVIVDPNTGYPLYTEEEVYLGFLSAQVHCRFWNQC